MQQKFISVNQYEITEGTKKKKKDLKRKKKREIIYHNVVGNIPKSRHLRIGPNCVLVGGFECPILLLRKQNGQTLITGTLQ